MRATGKAGKRIKEGVGLSNTRARLEQLYGSGYRLQFAQAEEGGLRVILEIPLRAFGSNGDGK